VDGVADETAACARGHEDEVLGAAGERVAGHVDGTRVARHGDGIQLGGTGALVTANTMTGNGDLGLYEHGVYAAAAATGWTISDNDTAVPGR
jgi:hypothetical protein